MVAKSALCQVLFRLVLPLCLLVSAVVRFNALSFMYAALLLVLPLLSGPTYQSMASHTGRYLRAVAALSVLALVGQVVFHVTLLSMPPYGDHLPNCEPLEKLVRQLGFQRLDRGSALDLIRLIGPDILMAVVGIVVLVICQKAPVPDITQFEEEVQEAEGVTGGEGGEEKGRSSAKETAASALQYIADVTFVFFLAACGIVYPSGLSAVYFLAFLGIATWWACFRSLGRVFVTLRLVLLLYAALHLLLLHLYQFQFFQEALSSEDVVARVVGLTSLIVTTCDDPRRLVFARAPWPVFVNPLVVFTFYWLLASDVRRWLPLPVQEPEAAAAAAPDTPAIAPRPLIKRRYSGRKRIGEYSQLLHEQQKKYDSTEKLDAAEGAGDACPSSPRRAAEEAEEAEESSSPGACYTAMRFISRQSYIAALIVMMAWGITYHSWLTFVLLLWACLVWVIPNSRGVCLLMSPAIVVYAEALLLVQFVFGMDLTMDELGLGGRLMVEMREIGLTKYEYPCLPLAIKTLFTLALWVMMRQFMRERCERQQEREAGGAEAAAAEQDTRRSLESLLRGPPKDSSPTKRISYWLLYQLTKYWIFVCAVMLLVMSLQNEVVIYRIFYMALFLVFIVTLQMSLRAWRALMLPFWIVVVLYSMVVLVLIYTYQFETFPDYWRNATGMSDVQLSDIGLEQYDTKELFISLLTPTSFLIIVILQVHYFHKAYIQMIDVDDGRKGAPPADGEEADAKDAESFEKDMLGFWEKLRGWLAAACEVAWRLLEIHALRVVAIALVALATFDVSLVNAVLAVLAVVALLLDNSCGGLAASHLAAVWTALLVLAKMCCQLQQVDMSVFEKNCTDAPDSPFNGTAEPTTGAWFGLEKTDNVEAYLKGYIGVIAALCVQAIARYRQQHHRAVNGIVPPPSGVVFPEVDRRAADDGIVECAKYLVNYAFYKFGVEISFLMTVVTVTVRMDAYAVVYILLLGVLLLLPRSALRVVYPVYVIALAVLLPVQYLLCLGLPAALCQAYPWSYLQPALREWLYLPDYWDVPEAHLLIADLFQLLFAIRLWRVFWRERDADYAGGSNDAIDYAAPNPVKDFITSGNTYLDKCKCAVFLYTYWVVLAMLFLAGTSRVSLYCMGYVMFCFLFLWFGNEFYLKPMKVINRMWSIVLAYNFCVMLLKACLEVVGCVYLGSLYVNFCWLVQLLSIACLRSSYDPSADPAIAAECSIPLDQAGLAWDCVCFVFLLAQRRIWRSHYFAYVVAEIRAQTLLASRGAELINEIFIDEVTKRDRAEREVVAKMKTKLDRIATHQAKLNAVTVAEPGELNHFQAIRAGDYYMFEDDVAEEVPITELEDETPGGASGEEDDGEPRTPGPLQLLNTAYQAGDVKKAVDEAKQAKEEGEVGSPTRERPPSRGEARAEEEGEEEEPPKQSCWSKVRNGCAFVWLFLCGVMDSASCWLNKISKDYRYVATTLAQEKRELKERDTSLRRIDVVSEHEPTPGDDDHDKDAGFSSDVVAVDEPNDVRIAMETDEEAAEEKPGKDEPSVVRLLTAIYYVAISRSELMCYFVIALNQMSNASVISLPLPLLVFFWGTLSMPRPTKTFWISLITYTEAVVVIKYLFQFNFYPWLDDINNDPFWPPRILGIEKRDKYAAWELVTLLALFFHRSILKSLGLWKDSADDIYVAAQHNEEDGAVDAPLPVCEAPARKEEEDGEGKEQEQEAEEDAPPTGSSLYVAPFKKFFNRLLRPTYRLPVDVYVFLFFCEFVCFLIIVLGYSGFGPYQGGGDDVASYLSENKIPIPFLVMLIAQFALIIVDRGIFLRKNVNAKLIYQFVLIVVVHVWMFFVLPAMTERLFVNNLPAKLWYLVKCGYFVLSAYQIRSGYPTRILGNFLTKSYNYVNLIAFKVFVLIPFVMEMRALMDWIWTDTTLSIFNWLKMEDIYATVFSLKCARRAEAAYPMPRAQPRKQLVKYLMGGGMLLLIIFFIWLPLVLFSLGNVVGVRNVPLDCSVVIQIGGYEPIIDIAAQQQDLVAFTDAQFDALPRAFPNNAAAKSFLNNYEAGDVLHVNLPGDSTSVWTASPPSREAMIDELAGNASDVHMTVSWSYTRASDGSVVEPIVKGLQLITLEPESSVRRQLIAVLRGATGANATVPSIIPKYMQVTSSEARAATALMPAGEDDWVTIQLTMSNDSTSEWWQLREVDARDGSISEHVTIVALLDKVFPSALSFLAGYGIIGLYISLVFVVGRFVRMFVSGLAERIMFEELPDVDRLLQLCLDIYLVRESREFSLEEDLFARLIFLYRSPATLIKWTKPKQE
ncbi:PREDICTED: piezo-type mechanosensitive ion channel component 1-like [Priapulus caudatus]|uniref:Piezo-type mechanosensitive ion channel component 1-like n=1 Tax=Priapulus caudatus TaxID=37621 RepID=A0ABM1EYR4_PRICU|nr:PREDICTED: piezo-type mechanosensitive ion channel component 1-like [Priapulus caudatus]